MSGANNEIFVGITNEMIYKRLIRIEKNISKNSSVTKFNTWAIGVIVIILSTVISAIV